MQNNRGSILIIVSGIIAALGLLAFTFLTVMSSRAREAQHNISIGEAREAAKSALEFCYSATYTGLYTSYMECREFQAADIPAAIDHVNYKVFDEERLGSLCFIQDRGQFVHDAFDLTPDNNAINGIYEGIENPLDLEPLLNPIGAVYNGVFESKFTTGTFVEPTELTDLWQPVAGESFAYIRYFGWGRVYKRLGEDSFVPVCDDLMTARVKIWLRGYVKLMDIDEPLSKTYLFYPMVYGTTEKRRLAFDDPLFPEGWEGKTWFMEDKPEEE